MTTPVSAGQSPSNSILDDLSLDDQTPNTRSARTRTRVTRRAILSDDSGGESATPTSTQRRGPGRPRMQTNTQYKNDKVGASIAPSDALPEEPRIEDDELVLAVTDEDGERKVDENGRLFGEREYRVRTFTILGRGQRLYMLSTEPARCVGYRDSYLFFLKHKTLHRIILDDNEKEDLAERELIPMGYRTRQLAVVSARSVFREFGAKVVIGGRRILDDYWTKEYARLGFEEGALADPADRLPPPGVPYNMNQFVAWHGASSVYHHQPQIEKRPTKRVINDVNWITAHAQAASEYNQELAKYRRRMLQGVHEAHTGQTVFPAISQPERCFWQAISPCDTQPPTIETAMVIRSCSGAGVHLLDVDETVYHDVKPEVLAAITTRRASERRERDMLHDVGLSTSEAGA